MTISSSERPNVVCGKRRLAQPRCRISKPSAAAGAVSARGSAGNAGRLSLGLEDITGAANRLQVARIARIALELAPQPRHLHIDITDVAAEPRRLRQLLARYRLPCLLRQDRQEAGLGGGQVNRIVAPEQFAAREVKTERAEPDLARRRRDSGPALQDVADAQDQLARLEWLDEIIVGAVLEAVDAVLRLAHRGQQQYRDARLGVSAQGTGQREPVLARHHDVEHDQIEGKARELGARLRGIGCPGHAKAAVAEIAAQQLAQPQIVVDDEKVGLGIGHRAGSIQKTSGARGAAVEPAAVVVARNDAEQHLAEAFDGLRAGLAIGTGDPNALRLGKLALQLAPALGQLQEPLAAVLRAAMLDDEAPTDELAQHPVEALFCDPQDRQQIADGHLRMTPDKMHDPVVRAPKAVLLEDRIGLIRKVAIGEKQQLDALPHFLLAQERRFAGDRGAGWGGRQFYVSHVDLFCSL